MFRFFLLLLTMFSVFSACKKTDILPAPPSMNEPDDEPGGGDLAGTLINSTINFCSPETSITPPTGYTIAQIGQVDFEGSLSAFQFINESVGYALGSLNQGGKVAAFKTENGGVSWTDLNVNFNQFPRSLYFLNELEGYITVHDITGCPPPNCLHKCIVLKTEDGGLTWTALEHENLKGIIYTPVLHSDGNMYALLSNGPEADKLITSTDRGQSWEILESPAVIDFQNINFSFRLFEDHIYLPGEEGKIIIIDYEGNILSELETGLLYLNDLKFYDENTFFISNFSSIKKTLDGGLTWDLIYDDDGRILNFSSPENGLVLISAFSCGGDIVASMDCFATTDDGGMTWENPLETRDLIQHFKQSSTLPNDNFLVLIENDFYRLKKQ